MAIEKAFFRQVMGHFATGVTVVTTTNRGISGGITVSAFCSVSLNPPLVLICIDNSSSATLSLLRASKIFAVNILGNEQETYSRIFATNTEERSKIFDRTAFRTAVTGAPILDNTLAFVDTRIVAEYPGGDHSIFIGQVVALGSDGKISYTTEEGHEFSAVSEQTVEGTQTLVQGDPLLYYKGQYHQIATPYQAPDTLKAHAGNIEEHVNGH